MACETALEWGKSPSAYLVPRDQWTQDVGLRDRTLEIAFTVFKQGLCSQCGYPRSVCGSEDRFSTQLKVCYASAAVETAQKDHKEPRPGEYHIPMYQQAVEI